MYYFLSEFIYTNGFGTTVRAKWLVVKHGDGLFIPDNSIEITKTEYEILCQII